MSDKKDTRSRVWTCIVYPKSAPKNWQTLLSNTHIQWLESPLHNQDLNSDGTFKIPHWHVLLKFGSKKSYQQVNSLVKSCLCGSNPQRVHDIYGMIRYFVHADNPEKAQYNRDLLIEHNGFSIGNAFFNGKNNKNQLIHEMIDFVRKNEIEEIYELIDYAAQNRFNDWFPLLTGSSLKVMETYIRSYHFSKKEQRLENQHETKLKLRKKNI